MEVWMMMDQESAMEEEHMTNQGRRGSGTVDESRGVRHISLTRQGSMNLYEIGVRSWGETEKW